MAAEMPLRLKIPGRRHRILSQNGYGVCVCVCVCVCVFGGRGLSVLCGPASVHKTHEALDLSCRE
eukprot:7508858-Alexandrium_andersonii.AAC.1